MKILIIDSDCPRAYSHETLHTEPVGGSEAIIVRVAEALATRHNVSVAQGSRQITQHSPAGVAYIPWHKADCSCEVTAPDRVITIGVAKLLPKIRRRYLQAKLYLWLHRFPGKRKRKYINILALQTQTTLVAVSNALRLILSQHMERYREGFLDDQDTPLAAVRVIYSPVDDNLKPDDTPCNPDKLVFFNSPDKGLDQVLKAFKEVYALRPHCKLYVINPGCMPFQTSEWPSGVRLFGSLTQQEVLAHVREAFCVFYPQYRFAEAFGRVFAEANAVGTPVLTHPIGAASEILNDPRQLVDARYPHEVSEKLLQWYALGRPQVSLDDTFRLSSVVAQWEDLLRERQPRHLPIPRLISRNRPRTRQRRKITKPE
jgi:glycosyltransferase involved in cell wall biosynthesis